MNWRIKIKENIYVFFYFNSQFIEQSEFETFDNYMRNII